MTKWLVLSTLLVPSLSLACDWKSSEKVDPMTDERVCLIRSPTAKISLAVRGSSVTFLTGSTYRMRDGLQVRIDDNPAIFIGDDRSTDAFEDHARDALAQIRTGERLRTHFRDYPSSQNGDAQICNLPELIDACK